MRLPSSLCALTLTFVVGCGSSPPPPASSADNDAEPAPAAATEPAATDTEAAPKSGGSDEGWEGEKAAPGAADKGEGKAAKPAPDTKGEETRTIEVISKIVKDHRQPVRDCYEKARKALPDLKGDMVIYFELNAEGKVKKIELNVERSTLKSPEVVDCAIKVIKGITFPPSSRGMDTVANYPYNLNP